jgi:di/tricarboxylate transporter
MVVAFSPVIDRRYNPRVEMNYEIAFILLVMGVALVAFVREWFPIEVTALGILATLVVAGILDVREALAGFSSTAAVAIGSLFVLSHALTKTGLLETVANRVADAARERPWPMIVVLLVLVCFGSGLLNNTAVVALSIPLVLKFCRRLELSPSKVLLPLSFASILGGTLTLIGTSTNLLVNSVVRDYGQPPIGMFELSIAGAAIAAAGLTYIVLFSRRMLPDRAKERQLTSKYRVGESLSELSVGETSKLVGSNLVAEQINERYRVTVLQVIRGRTEAFLEDAASVALQHGDLLIVQGEVDDILRFRREQRLTLVPEVKVDDDELIAGGQLLEAWVAPGSSMIGRTLRGLEFHRHFGAYALAISRVKGTLRRRVSRTRLKVGDALLILIPPARVPSLEQAGDVVIFGERDATLRIGRLWWLPLVVMPLVVLAAAFGGLDIAAAALVGAVSLLLFGVIRPQEAYRAVDWSVIFVIAAFVPVGHAFQVTGTADFLARSVLTIGGWAPVELLPYVVLSLVYIVTVALTQVVSNNAAAVVVAPIALSLGPALGVDSRPFVMAVCFAASAAFMTPMGYQTNLMVHAAGEYNFSDYVRFGAPLNLLVGLLALILLPLIWTF